jgi:mRNA interferase HigB
VHFRAPNAGTYRARSGAKIRNAGRLLSWRGREPVNAAFPIFGIWCYIRSMIVIGTDLVESYFADRSGHKGIKAAWSQYQAWLGIVSSAQWRHPEDVNASYPKASILKASRVVFNIKGNIKGNDFRLVTRIQYQAGVLAIRFFGTHAECDKIDAETV